MSDYERKILNLKKKHAQELAGFVNGICEGTIDSLRQKHKEELASLQDTLESGEAELKPISNPLPINISSPFTMFREVDGKWVQVDKLVTNKGGGLVDLDILYTHFYPPTAALPKKVTPYKCPQMKTTLAIAKELNLFFTEGKYTGKPDLKAAWLCKRLFRFTSAITHKVSHSANPATKMKRLTKTYGNTLYALMPNEVLSQIGKSTIARKLAKLIKAELITVKVEKKVYAKKHKTIRWVAISTKLRQAVALKASVVDNHVSKAFIAEFFKTKPNAIKRPLINNITDVALFFKKKKDGACSLKSLKSLKNKRINTINLPKQIANLKLNEPINLFRKNKRNNVHKEKIEPLNATAKEKEFIRNHDFSNVKAIQSNENFYICSPLDLKPKFEDLRYKLRLDKRSRDKLRASKRSPHVKIFMFYQRLKWALLGLTPRQIYERMKKDNNKNYYWEMKHSMALYKIFHSFRYQYAKIPPDHHACLFLQVAAIKCCSHYKQDWLNNVFTTPRRFDFPLILSIACKIAADIKKLKAKGGDDPDYLESEGRFYVPETYLIFDTNYARKLLYDMNISNDFNELLVKDSLGRPIVPTPKEPQPKYARVEVIPARPRLKEAARQIETTTKFQPPQKELNMQDFKDNKGAAILAIITQLLESNGVKFKSDTIIKATSQMEELFKCNADDKNPEKKEDPVQPPRDPRRDNPTWDQYFKIKKTIHALINRRKEMLSEHAQELNDYYDGRITIDYAYLKEEQEKDLQILNKTIADEKIKLNDEEATINKQAKETSNG